LPTLIMSVVFFEVFGRDSDTLIRLNDDRSRPVTGRWIGSARAIVSLLI
jgi:hypothetical protein